MGGQWRGLNWREAGIKVRLRSNPSGRNQSGKPPAYVHFKSIKPKGPPGVAHSTEHRFSEFRWLRVFLSFKV